MSTTQSTTPIPTRRLNASGKTRQLELGAEYPDLATGQAVLRRAMRGVTIGGGMSEKPGKKSRVRNREQRPAGKQIERRRSHVNGKVRRCGQEHGLAIAGRSPLVQGGVLEGPAIAEIAGRLGRTPGQVV